MGVNLRAIEYVLHYGLPTTPTAFLQESGRAGREGDACHSVALIHPGIRGLRPTMARYKSETTCLRKILLSEFETSHETQLNCCTNCGSRLPTLLHGLENMVSHRGVSASTSTDSQNVE